MRTAIWL